MQRARHDRSRLKGVLVASSAVLLAIGTSCFSRGSGVETVVVSLGKGQIVVTASGTLEASKLSRVAPQVSGKVIEIHVSDGDRVEDGQLLYKLDPAPYQKAAASARDQASTARAAISRLTGGSSGSSGSSASAGANTRRVMESGEAVTQPIVTITPPASVNVVVPAMPSSALLAAQEADAKALVAQVQGAMTSEFGKRVQPLVAGALAQAKVAEAEAAKADEAVEETEVRAPMAGVVSFLPLGSAQDIASGSAGGERVSVGRVITAGQPVMAVYDLADPVARAKVPESEIAKIRVGENGTVKLTAFGGKKITAKVSRVSLEPGRSELGAIAYQVELSVSGDEVRGWRPGMSATVEIVVEELENVIELPGAAVFTRDAQDFVYVIEDGRANARRVDASKAGGGKVLVRSGLKAGDRVAITKIEKLTDGASV